MSKLQAPGFASRLKPPGALTQPGNSTDDGVFKRPQSLPVSRATQQGTSNRTTTSQRGNGFAQKKLPSPTVAPTQHGPSPYDRIKPPASQIPYVGKKRTTGVIKAPVARTNFTTQNNAGRTLVNKQGNMTTTALSKEGNNISSNSSTTQATKQLKKPNSAGGPRKTSLQKSNDSDSQNDLSQQKPVRRQLIPETSAKQAAIPRPQSATDLARPSFGFAKPKALGRNNKSSKTTGMAGGKSLSKSLQSLSQSAKLLNNNNNNKSISNKSVSQSDLRKPSSKSLQQTGLQEPRGKHPTSKFGFGPPQARQRASSSKANSSGIVSISTPCQPGKKHRDQIKISPIAVEGDKLHSIEDSHFTESCTVVNNTTFQSTKQKEVADDDIDDTDGGISSPEFDEPQSKYEQTALLGNTDLDIRALCNNNVNESIFFTGAKEQNPTLNTTTTIAKEKTMNATFQKIPNENVNATFSANQTFNLNGTQCVNSTFAVDEMNKTHNIDTNVKLQNSSISPVVNDDTFHEPKVKHETILVDKSDENETIENHLSKNKSLQPNAFHESEFIENVIMPDLATPFRNDSFLVEQTQNESFTVDVNKVIAAITCASELPKTVAVVSSPTKANTQMFFRSLSDDIERAVNDTTHADSLTRAVSVMDEPKTPLQDDNDSCFDLGTRSYTISMGALGRKGASGRLRRHYTLGSQDLSRKFRIPRQLNTVETLEGNIVMDNTAFLQFSNDVKAMKTQLLKLKRTLLEADCSSPLVKDSSGVSVRQPPLSPRSSELPSVPPLHQRTSHSSPLAVVDPLVKSSEEPTTPAKQFHKDKEKTNEDMVSITTKFTQALRRIEELEKSCECDKYTIKLLQTQLENYEQKELDILEENIILREQNGILNEKLHAIQACERERKTSTGSSYEDFDVGESRKNILQRLYSNEAYNSE